MKLGEFSAIMPVEPYAALTFDRVVIDSRKVMPNDVFVALKGERFDAHDFLPEVAQKGAVLAIVQHKNPDLPLPQIEVASPFETLVAMAQVHRASMHCPVIAVTGSNGKTSVKEMIACILPPPSFATRGNLNNHLGVPLSVLSLNATHQYAVFELGANHVGEIAQTVALVQPQVALINNIAPAHIGEFGSIDAVAVAKGEIYQGLAAPGVAIVNNDDAYAHFWDVSLKDKKVLRFGLEHPESCEIYAKEIQLSPEGCGVFVLVTPEGELPVALKVPGYHNIKNALAAAAATYALGLSITQIQQGLQAFGGVSGRLTTYLTPIGGRVIDDTYNANLRSVLAAIDVLAGYSGQKLLIFGDMGELGPYARDHHEAVGLAAKRQGIDYLYTCGKLSQYASESFGAKARHFENQDDLITATQGLIDAQTTVLVKGSRASKMEKIVQQLIG